MELTEKDGVLVFFTEPKAPLPHWADGHLDGEFTLYAQLATKDGRRFGNAIIIGVEPGDSIMETRYQLLTDFGNTITLSATSVANCFHPPKFRMKKHLAEYRTGAMEAYLFVERSVAF